MPALELVAEEGPRSFYDGTLADALLALMDERGGLVTRADLGAYEARWSDPVEVAYAGTRFLTRGGPVRRSRRRSPRLPRLRGLSPAERALALARALDGAGPRKPHDQPRGRRRRRQRVRPDDEPRPRLGRLPPRPRPAPEQHARRGRPIRGALEPGERMGSMMAPSVALDGDGVALAAGAAGGTRLRSALLQVVAGILDEGLDPQDGGLAAAAAPGRRARAPRAGLRRRRSPPRSRAPGYEVRAWPERHHYFGGVSVVTRNGCAGDPRRSGARRLVLPRERQPTEVAAVGATGIRLGRSTALRAWRTGCRTRGRARTRAP